MSNYKHFILIFTLIRAALFLRFCFVLHQMVDSKCNSDNYKTLKISIGAIIKDPEMFEIQKGLFLIILRLNRCVKRS